MGKDKKISLTCDFNHVIGRGQFCFSYDDGRFIHSLDKAADNKDQSSFSCSFRAGEVKEIINFLNNFLKRG